MVEIDRLGDQGDGLADLAGLRLFVPGTLPGERLRVRLEERRGDGLAATPLTWLHEVPRATPPCPHFGPCGGCRLQHLAPADYAAFKRELLVNALRRRGLEPEIAPLVRIPPGTRRRLRLAFRHQRGRVQLGLRARRGHAVIDVHACPIARPTLVALFDPLRLLLLDLGEVDQGEIGLAACRNGVDLLIHARTMPGLRARERLAAFAEDRDLARLSWTAGGEPEPILIRREPLVEVAGLAVGIPPQAFLQASREAEDAMRDEVGRAVGEASRVTDLFAGIGTFSLPLAASGARGLALERDPAAVQALSGAARTLGLANRIAGEVRDLDRRPLMAAELDGVEAVVLDPPRAGARAQAEALAGSRVPRIAYVSCHPGSFARDARILVDGGYRLTRAVPIDAFLWSAETELVATFLR